METSQQDTTDWTSVLFDLRRSVSNLVLYVLESMPLPWLLTPSAAAAAAASPSPVQVASPVMASQPQQQPQQPQQPPWSRTMKETATRPPWRTGLDRLSPCPRHCFRLSPSLYFQPPRPPEG